MRSGTRASTRFGGLRRQAGAGADHRRDEGVEGEDRRGREARQHRDRLAVGDREAERLAGLERHAMHQDAGLAELATRPGARGRRRPSRCRPRAPPCRIRRARGAPRRSQRRRVVREGAERHRLAAGFGDGGGEDRAVEIVDAARPQRCRRARPVRRRSRAPRPSAAAPRRRRQARRPPACRSRASRSSGPCAAASRRARCRSRRRR